MVAGYDNINDIHIIPYILWFQYLIVAERWLFRRFFDSLSPRFFRLSSQVLLMEFATLRWKKWCLLWTQSIPLKVWRLIIHFPKYTARFTSSESCLWLRSPQLQLDITGLDAPLEAAERTGAELTHALPSGVLKHGVLENPPRIRSKSQLKKRSQWTFQKNQFKTSTWVNWGEFPLLFLHTVMALSQF